ncbi:MAG: NifB/NifX family molybdenum-iron cluster-binding protein [Deltaproteobacteria bacterium]|nr:NifB/NifX family molybdenum-iron cluster-binding protein [Candidatus Anaeroferrophillacea bacterium]
MKIAVSSTGQDLDAAVDPRFGRCSYFIVYDDADGSHEALPNRFQGASGGAGTQAAQQMLEYGVQVVLTGNCGPNAFTVLQGAGVKVCTGVGGTVRQAVEGYRSGVCDAAARPNAEAHAGMGAGPGVGGGRGMGGGGGRGMGGGGGRGMGGGGGRGMGGDRGGRM